MTLRGLEKRARFQPAALGLAGATALTSALWVAVSAAAPEFIWRGLMVTLGHLDLGDVVQALLIGLILAFFVEPLMRTLQRRVEGEPQQGAIRPRPRNALFTAGMGFAFAFASVCVHDAMTAFVSAAEPEHAGAATGIQAGILLTVAWAIVPFATTLGWMAAGNRWLRVPFGLAAAASGWFAGWLFGWTPGEIIDTMVPSLAILGLGYRAIGKDPLHETFARCARSVLLVAAVWIVSRIIASLILSAFHLLPDAYYSSYSVWLDVRFFAGWAIGLVLAPFPHAQAEGGSRL